jgi:CheY-like chemotaxis protein
MDGKTGPHRILVIDDCPEDRELYRRLIAQGEEAAYLFWETGSGEEGLQLYHSEHPDCVVLDYNLPDLDGLEFLAKLPPEPNVELPPIVMLTGQGNEMVAVEALKRGAEDYLVKDRAAEQLKRIVCAAMEKAALQSQINEQRRIVDQAIHVLRAIEESCRQWSARTLWDSEERFRLLVECVTGNEQRINNILGHLERATVGASRRR